MAEEKTKQDKKVGSWHLGIRDSESVSSVEICTISMDKSAMDRKRFNASILFGNYLLNIRRNSSIF